MIGLDVWEGNLGEIDEALLKQEGVKYIITRLNSMNGGHRLDRSFLKQWEESAGFVRWPYFVYNPWVSGEANFAWLAGHLPLDATHVSLDVEVKYSGISAGEYARQVKRCYELMCERWSVDIYTGGWFLNQLESWPAGRYWWARYLNRFYPKDREVWSWERLRREAAATSWNPGGSLGIPGSCQVWQVSGDRLLLPGCGTRAVDVNLFSGSEAELAAYVGGSAPGGGVGDWAAAIDAWARTMGYEGVGPHG